MQKMKSQGGNSTFNNTDSDLDRLVDSKQFLKEYSNQSEINDYEALFDTSKNNGYVTEIVDQLEIKN